MVPGSKTSRAQPWRRGMAAWCSWKARWEQAEDAEATGPAGREEMQRARAEAGNKHSTERSWWSSPTRGGLTTAVVVPRGWKCSLCLSIED